MTVPTHHLRAILDAFERRGVAITKITGEGQNIAASGGGLLVECFPGGTFSAAVSRPPTRIAGKGASPELAIAAAVAEARTLADEVASVLTVPSPAVLPSEVP